MTAPVAGPRAGEPRIPERPRLFGAFGYRDYRLLWLGLFGSYVGFWMQFTAMTYLVGVVLAHDAAESAFNLGILGAVRSVPVFVFGPLAGFFADHFPRRRLLLVVNTVQAILAFSLGFVARSTGDWVLAAVYLIAALQATAQCFEAPARQSWIPLLVPRQVLTNAIGMISVSFNLPMMVGPAIGGVLIGFIGIPPLFFVNAVLTLGVLLALVMMKPSPVASRSREPMLRQIADGFRFVASHPVLRYVVLVLIIVALFLRPLNQLMAAYATHIVHVDAKGYGWLLTAGGIGTLTGAIAFAGSRSERRAMQWMVSSAIAALALLGLAFTSSFALAMVLQVVMGLGLMVCNSCSNTFMQTLSPDEMRGRVMSLYSNLQQAVIPLGTLLLGAIGSVSGLPIALAVSGVLALIAIFWVWRAHPALRQI